MNKTQTKILKENKHYIQNNTGLFSDIQERKLR